MGRDHPAALEAAGRIRANGATRPDDPRRKDGGFRESGCDPRHEVHLSQSRDGAATVQAHPAQGAGLPHGGPQGGATQDSACEPRDAVDPDLICEGYVNVAELSADETGFVVFPNPFRDHLTIQLRDRSYSTVSCSVFDSFGKVVVKEFFGATSASQILSLNANALTEGIYFIQLVLDNESFSRMIVRN